MAALMMTLPACMETAVASAVNYQVHESGDSISLTNVYGADANPTGNPIGGGPGYNSILLTGDYVVSTAGELVAALQRALAGQVVYVRSGVEIDLTNYPALQIASGVTLAGDRGNGSSPGPLLFTNSTRSYPVLDATGTGVRVTGLRLRGADGGVDPIDNVSENLSVAIRSAYANLEVDNCEIYNFSRTGVSVEGADGYVHHNYIHHVRREGLGYPVQVGGTALIEANIFDYYRHAIAATGFPGVGYEARYNIAYEHSTSHVFDMHGGGDFCVKQYSFHPYCTDDEWWMAGDWFSIHHNTFYALDKRSILIRGVPRQFGEVHHNWFMHKQPMQAFAQTYFQGNVALFDNVYGENKVNMGKDQEPSFLVRDLGGLKLMGITAAKYNAIVDIVESPGDKLHIGFDSPLDSGSGLEVRGVLTVEVEIDHGGLLEIDQVQVLLDDKVIYSAKEAPAKNALQIDTRQLSDQSHELTLRITDARGGAIVRKAHIKVKNWLLLVDEFLPPMQSGFFGGLDLSPTAKQSNGWRYVGDQPDLFFGDADRKVRQAATTEYLVYHTPNIKRFQAVLYMQTATPWQAAAFTIHLSSDGENWTPFSYSLSGELSDTGEWRRLVVAGVLDEPLEAHWLKVTVDAAIPAGALQLGRLEIQSANWR